MERSGFPADILEMAFSACPCGNGPAAVPVTVAVDHVLFEVKATALSNFVILRVCFGLGVLAVAFTHFFST